MAVITFNTLGIQPQEDLPNATTLVVEIWVGIIITLTVYYLTRKDQKKDVNQIVTNLKEEYKEQIKSMMKEINNVKTSTTVNTLTEEENQKISKLIELVEAEVGKQNTDKEKVKDLLKITKSYVEPYGIFNKSVERITSFLSSL